MQLETLKSYVFLYEYNSEKRRSFLMHTQLCMISASHDTFPK